MNRQHPAITRRERAIRRLTEEQHWMAAHGGSEAAYVARYGSASDPDHYGNGGEAIYAADMAALNAAQEEALEAIREARNPRGARR